MTVSSDGKKNQIDRISDALLAGRKLEAIKAYQEMTGLGLRECKEAIDGMESSLKTQQPESFSKNQKSPSPLIAIVLALIVLGVVFSIFAGK